MRSALSGIAEQDDWISTKFNAMDLALQNEHPSSPYFFDKYTGWDGLCAEPHQGYHADLRKKRSYIHVPKCLPKNVTKMPQKC